MLYLAPLAIHSKLLTENHDFCTRYTYVKSPFGLNRQDFVTSLLSE